MAFFQQIAKASPPSSPSESTGDGGSESRVATPVEELSLFVTWASALFYEVESRENPQVQTYWDAFHYISTSVSVGYANIFPVTQLGKIIGGIVMMVGPALAAKALDPANSTEGVTAPAPADPALLAKLDELIVEMKRIRTIPA